MEIWVTTHLYPTPGRADLRGDALAIHEFAREWVRSGHKVTVLHAYMHSYSGLNRAKLLLPMIRLDNDENDGVRILRAELRLVKTIDSVRRVFMAEAGARFTRALEGAPRPDIILSHFPVITAGLPEGISADCPRAAVLHTTDILRLRGRPSEIYGALGFRSARIMKDYKAKCDESRPEFLVYSGAPDMSFGPVRRTGGPLRILYVGKLIRRKQPDLLIRAVRALPSNIDWRLSIVGDGPMREELALMAGTDQRIVMTGPLEREEVARQMFEHDAFVMLSHGETFGLVYLEAMAAGMITVGTAGEGIDGVIVDGENGFLLDAGDERGLARLIERIAGMSSDEREAISARAIDTARRMNSRDMAEDYLMTAMRLAGGEANI